MMRRVTLSLLLGLVVFSSARAAEIEPLSTGPHAVGSTNFEARVPSGGEMQEYLIGSSSWFTSERYVAQLFQHPDAVFRATARPANRSAFEVAGYVLYPTTRDNPRPAYVFPYTNTGDNVFPHMQRAGEQPIFAEPGRRWPVIVASHGYNAHGLWELDRWKRVASHGYIVVSIFHGDGRWSFGENHPRRPVAVSAMLDRLLADPDFAPAVDAERIGASGSSFGAYTILACLGATMSASGRADHHDPRLKAGLGLVPYAGGLWGNHPFGKDFAGLRSVKTPYLAIYGGADNAQQVIAATAQCAGTTLAVELAEEKHLLSEAAWTDVPTWEILFFNAWLKDDARARELLGGELAVRGGVADRVTQRNGQAVAP